MDIFKLGRIIPLRYSLTLIILMAGLYAIVVLAPGVFVGKPGPRTDFMGTVTMAQHQQRTSVVGVEDEFQYRIENEAGQTRTIITRYPLNCYRGDRALHTSEGKLTCAAIER